MKRTMRNLLTMIMAFVVLVTMLFNSINGCHAEASSKARKAKAAYAKLLSSWNGSGTDVLFAVIDINKDGISEMIYSDDNLYHTEFMGYINNKVKLLHEGFSGKQKYYPNKSLYYSYSGGHSYVSYSYYKFTGKKLKCVAEKKTENSIVKNPVYEYTVNGKKATKRQYKNYSKKLMIGAKEVKLKFHKNTESNRKRYL